MNQVGSIMVLFKAGEYESNDSLDGIYLLGFFAQRQKLRQKNHSDNKEGEDEHELEEQD